MKGIVNCRKLSFFIFNNLRKALKLLRFNCIRNDIQKQGTQNQLSAGKILFKPGNLNKAQSQILWHFQKTAETYSFKKITAGIIFQANSRNIKENPVTVKINTHGFLSEKMFFKGIKENIISGMHFCCRISHKNGTFSLINKKNFVLYLPYWFFRIGILRKKAYGNRLPKKSIFILHRGILLRKFAKFNAK